MANNQHFPLEVQIIAAMQEQQNSRFLEGYEAHPALLENIIIHEDELAMLEHNVAQHEQQLGEQGETVDNLRNTKNALQNLEIAICAVILIYIGGFHRCFRATRRMIDLSMRLSDIANRHDQLVRRIVVKQYKLVQEEIRTIGLKRLHKHVSTLRGVERINGVHDLLHFKISPSARGRNFRPPYEGLSYWNSPHNLRDLAIRAAQVASAAANIARATAAAAPA